MALALKASPRGETTQLAIVRPGYRKRVGQTDATVTIDGKAFKTSALSYPLKGDKRRVTHLVNLSDEASAALRRAADLHVKVVEGVDQAFPLGQIAPAWAQLDVCIEKLWETWNIGQEREARIAVPARSGPLQALFSSDDYPISMLIAQKSGSTEFGLMIDENGRVRDCTLMEPSGVALLDSRSCGIIMARGKFTPAVGADGKPIKSFWVQRVTWRIAR